MFTLNLTHEKTPLEKARDEAIETLRQLDPGSNEYGEVLDRVHTLEKMVLEYKPDPPNYDTMIKAGALVVSVLVIVAFEKSNIWTTKATPLLLKFL